MTDFISVILPTYNPNITRLTLTISGLKHQTLAHNNWELIVVDNSSTPAVNIDLSWHPNNKIINATRIGLTFARLKGFEQAVGSIIVMVDDDNILSEDYLTTVREIFKTNKELGSAGGKSLPIFEKTPPKWVEEFYSNLALRDLGETELTGFWGNEYPSFAPIGAGMAIRKEALTSYKCKSHLISDRKGSSLSSGGDNDITVEILKLGWQTGYFPNLILHHLIPVNRVSVVYLAQLLHDSNKSWIQLLEHHGINPWRKISDRTVLYRKIKAWFVYRAWKKNANYIRWKGACGTFEGLVE